MSNFEVRCGVHGLEFDDEEENLSMLIGLLYKAQYLCMAYKKEYNKKPNLGTAIGRLESIVHDIQGYDGEEYHPQPISIFLRMEETGMSEEEVHEERRGMTEEQKREEIKRLIRWE